MNCARFDARQVPVTIDRPPAALLKRLAKRIANSRIVLFPGDLFVGRAVERDEMITRDTALLRVKLGQLNGFRNVLVEEDDRSRRERGLRQPVWSKGNEQCQGDALADFEVRRHKDRKSVV